MHVNKGEARAQALPVAGNKHGVPTRTHKSYFPSGQTFIPAIHLLLISFSRNALRKFI
jgi:hypothetical protein